MNPPAQAAFLLCALLTSAASAVAAPAREPAPLQGYTEPYRFATMSSETASRITQVRINEGGRARKGDTILVLDPEEAALEAERTRIIAENESELAAARLKVEMARRDLLSTRQVYDSTRSVSREEYLKKELEFNLARTEVDRLTMVHRKSALERAIAYRNLRRHYLIAPYDGIVAQRLLNEGETCKPQEPLIKFVDVSRCRLIAYVPVNLARGLTKGAKVGVRVGDPKNGPEREGTVDFLSPVVDQASGLRTAKIVFDNADGSLQPGLTGWLRLEK